MCVTPVYGVSYPQTAVTLDEGSFRGGIVPMSARELIASRVTIDINAIRRSSSSRRARQQKGMHSAEVKLWKRLT